MPAKTHGESYTPEYRTWIAMRSRCGNPNHTAFKNYGGRGIRVCDRWSSYEAFLADMGRKPSPEHTIERRDNERGYEPGNCHWATRAEQLRNRRNTARAIVDGRAVSVAELAEQHGIPLTTLTYRIRQGWSIKEALDPQRFGRGLGRKLTAAQVERIRDGAARGVPRRDLAERHGVTPTTIGHVVRGDTWKATS